MVMVHPPNERSPPVSSLEALERLPATGIGRASGTTTTASELPGRCRRQPRPVTASIRRSSLDRPRHGSTPQRANAVCLGAACGGLSSSRRGRGALGRPIDGGRVATIAASVALPGVGRGWFRLGIIKYLGCRLAKLPECRRRHFYHDGYVIGCNNAKDRPRMIGRHSEFE